MTDDLLGTIGTIPRLDPGETSTLTANDTAPATTFTTPTTATATGQRRNVARVVGTPANAQGQPLGLPDVSDQDAACVSVGPPPPDGEGCTPDTIPVTAPASVVAGATGQPASAPPGTAYTWTICSSPFARWIAELAVRGITAGCGGGHYCPTSPVTRGQVAAFLTRTFGLVFP